MVGKGTEPTQDTDSVWDVVTMTKRTEHFDRTVRQIMTKCSIKGRHAFLGAMKAHCQGKIDLSYTKKNVVPKADVLIALSKRNGWSLGGFALAEWRTQHGLTTFYIHVLCSGKRKGSHVIKICERYARSHGAHLIALHATTLGLISYYHRFGFKRSANACRTTITRADRYEIREIDSPEFAGYFMSKCL